MLRKSLLLLASAIPAIAAQPLELDLSRAIEMALAKNFSIEVQRYDAKIARERERAAWGKFDAQLDLSASRSESAVRNRFATDPITGETRHFGVSEFTESGNWSAGVSGVSVWGLGYDVRASVPKDGNSYTGELAFSLRQPLLRNAGTDANLRSVRIARNNIVSSEWSVKAQVMQVITDVIAAYNELHFARENHDVAKRSQELARQLLQDNIKRAVIGVMTELDVTTAQAEVAAREEAVITTARSVKDRENFLKQLVTADLIALLGRPVQIAPPTAPRFEDNVVRGITQALELRPDYQQGKLDLANHHINLAYEKNQALPQLDLVASLALNSFDDDFGTSVNRLANRDQTNWTAGAIFSFPIGNHTARANVSSEKLGIAQALAELKRLEQDIVVSVDNARGAVVTAQQRIEATAESVRLAKESLAAGEKRLIAGASTVFEVLELQDKLASAATSALRARADFNEAVARYHQATGTTLAIHHVVLQ